MKKAIAYIRISTKDQSNFSLSGQEQYINEYATKNNYEIIALFKDDGQSAKNFDRPDWKKLQEFCKKNHINVDALIVSKFDRFSRNLKDALTMIEVLEEKYKISIISAMEPIPIDHHSPFFFQFRTQMLMGAQVEWLIIKERTRIGMNTALKSGRYISKAPVGYINARDNQNKPILLIDEAKAPIIRTIFSSFLQGISLKEIKTIAIRSGFKKTYKSAIRETLVNPVYAGLVRVPTINNQPEHIVKGLHDGIISETDYWKVQQILASENKIHRTVLNDQVPLRSVLKCVHGHPLTAGNSKGKKNYYWYYRNECCKAFNLPAKKLHEQLNEIWQNLSLPDHYINYLQQSIEKQLQQRKVDADFIEKDKKRELLNLQQQLDKVEEKFINDSIDADAYQKWKNRYQQEIAIIQQYITESAKPVEQILSFFKANLSRLSNLSWHYNTGDLYTKQAMLKMVFNSQLYYSNGIYRTPYILPAFLSKAALLKEKELLIIEQPLQKSNKIGSCTPPPPSIEHLQGFIQLLSTVKTA